MKDYNSMKKVANSLCEEIARFTMQYNNNCKLFDETVKISLSMLHMGCDRMMSIASLLENGFEMTIAGKSLIKPSFFSPYPIARSLYEMMLVHHSIFANANSKEKMQVLLNLWKIKGYKQRIKYYNETTIQYKEQKERDTDNMITLIQRIKSTAIYEKCKDQFDHAFESDKLAYFEIIEEGQKMMLISTSFGNKDLFCRIYKDTDGLSEIDNDVVYNYLSLLSHPSYISILQFNQQEQVPVKELPLECALFFVYRMINTHKFLLARGEMKDVF